MAEEALKNVRFRQTFPSGKELKEGMWCAPVPGGFEVRNLVDAGWTRSKQEPDDE